MNEKQIIFSGPMVQAILEGRKTQTRRVVAFLPEYHNAQYVRIKRDARISKYDPVLGIAHPDAYAACPHGKVGDRLWVKEVHYLYGRWRKEGGHWRFRQLTKGVMDNTSVYYADAAPDDIAETRTARGWHKRTPLFMPRWASRLTLEITDVRVERLREMHHKTEAFESEGIQLSPSELYPHINRADKLERCWVKGWNALNAKRGYSWESNPWVWVITFSKCN